MNSGNWSGVMETAAVIFSESPNVYMFSEREVYPYLVDLSSIMWRDLSRIKRAVAVEKKDKNKTN